MKNLRKFIGLALSVVMALGMMLMVTGCGDSGEAEEPAASDDPVAACAELIASMVSDPEEVRILGTERGIPLNYQGYDICSKEGIIGEIPAEAYHRMTEWISFRIDPDFEHASLKGVNGVYEDVFTGLSYGDYTVAQAAERLSAGIQAVLAGE